MSDTYINGVPIRLLPNKPDIDDSDYLIVEDDKGTKYTPARAFKTYVFSNMYFDTVDDMSKYTKFEIGDICKTVGYYVAGDGGGASYVIMEARDNIDVDGSLYISIGDGSKIASLVSNYYISSKQLGAKCNGEYNDAAVLRKIVDLMNEGNNVHIEVGEYLLSFEDSEFEIKHDIDCNGALFVLDNYGTITIKNTSSMQYTIENFKIFVKTTMLTDKPIIRLENNITLKNFVIYTNSARVPSFIEIASDSGVDIYIDNGILESAANSILCGDAISIKGNGNYVKLSNCYFKNVYNGIYLYHVSDNIIDVYNCKFIRQVTNEASSKMTAIDIQVGTYAHNEVTLRDIVYKNVHAIEALEGDTDILLDNITASLIEKDRSSNIIYGIDTLYNIAGYCELTMIGIHRYTVPILGEYSLFYKCACNVYILGSLYYNSPNIKLIEDQTLSKVYDASNTTQMRLSHRSIKISSFSEILDFSEDRDKPILVFDEPRNAIITYYDPTSSIISTETIYGIKSNGPIGQIIGVQCAYLNVAKCDNIELLDTETNLLNLTITAYFKKIGTNSWKQILE